MKDTKINKRILRVIYGLLAAMVFLVPFYFARLWHWFWLCVGILVLVIASEIYAVLTDGISISGQFWEWRDKHPGWAWVVACVLTVGWFFLMYHLMLAHKP